MTTTDAESCPKGIESTSSRKPHWNEAETYEK